MQTAEGDMQPALAPGQRRPIGVFDSGVGGLSVLREIADLLPAAPLVYVADSGHVPYGTKSPAFIRSRSEAIVRFLLEDQGASVIVVACNTATTHAVDRLRDLFPHTPIVGMEPAIKPAAAVTRSGVVGVLATGATLDGDRFASLVQRFTDHVQVLTQPCPGLVEQVEAGELSGPVTETLLRTYTRPLLERGADTLVLGCTHYPFLRESLQRIVGPEVRLIDTGLAVARQTARVMGDHIRCPPPTGALEAAPLRAFASGDIQIVGPVIERLWGRPVVVARLRE